MRLVSQDGKIDVSYEQVAIEIEGNDIYCGYSSIVTRNCTGRRFAEYSNNEKALKAMKMLREEYQKYYSNNGGGMMATANFYIQPFAFNHPKVFQFPKDEEIEV